MEYNRRRHTIDAWQVDGEDWQNAPNEALELVINNLMFAGEWVCRYKDNHYSGFSEEDFKRYYKKRHLKAKKPQLFDDYRDGLPVMPT